MIQEQLKKIAVEINSEKTKGVAKPVNNNVYAYFKKLGVKKTRPQVGQWVYLLLKGNPKMKSIDQFCEANNIDVKFTLKDKADA